MAVTRFECENDPTILMYSKVFWSEGTKPARIVLRKVRDDEWVTHLETLKLVVAGDIGTWTHDAYHWGHYFSAGTPERLGEAYEQAVNDYKERCKTV